MFTVMRDPSDTGNCDYYAPAIYVASLLLPTPLYFTRFCWLEVRKANSNANEFACCLKLRHGIKALVTNVCKSNFTHPFARIYFLGK